MLKVILSGALLFSATPAAWAQSPPGLSGSQISELVAGATVEIDTPAGTKLPVRYTPEGRLSGEARDLAWYLGSAVDSAAGGSPATSSATSGSAGSTPSPSACASSARAGFPLAHPGRKHRHRRDCDRRTRAGSGLDPAGAAARVPQAHSRARSRRGAARARRSAAAAPGLCRSRCCRDAAVAARSQRGHSGGKFCAAALARHHQPVAAATAETKQPEIKVAAAPPTRPAAPAPAQVEPKRAADPLFKVANVRRR